MKREIRFFWLIPLLMIRFALRSKLKWYDLYQWGGSNGDIRIRESFKHRPRPNHPTGGAIALNNSDNVGVIIAGIIGGAIIGNVIEESANIHAATKYVLKTDTNAIFTVVQVNKSNPIFYSGDKVILVYGYPSRLIADPR